MSFIIRMLPIMSYVISAYFFIGFSIPVYLFLTGNMKSVDGLEHLGGVLIIAGLLSGSFFHVW